VFKEEPIKNAKAAEDFLYLVFTSYIIVAAENVQSASKTNHVMFVAKQIVSKFCDLSIGKESNHTNSDNPDCVLAYSKELMTYHDAIQEGDGERVKRYWKFM